MWCCEEAGGEGQALGYSFGSLAAAKLGLLLATSHTLCRSLAHLGSSGASLRSVGDSKQPKQAKAVGRGHSRGGRLRGPNRMGNLAMPGLVGRTFVWWLSVNTTGKGRSQRRASQISSGQSVSLWMSSLRDSPPGWFIPTGRKGRHGLPR